MMTGPQIREARELLGWDRSQLARRARISVTTVRDAEREAFRPHPRTSFKVMLAFRSAGLAFEAGARGLALRIRPSGA